MSQIASVCYSIASGTAWAVRSVCQLVGNLLAVNYRLVTTFGQIVGNFYQALTVLLSAVIRAFLDILSYFGYCIVISLTWLFDGACFGWYCCMLLCRIVYSALSAVTDCIFFVIQAIMQYGRSLGTILPLEKLFAAVSNSIFSVWTASSSAVVQLLRSLADTVSVVSVCITSFATDLVNNIGNGTVAFFNAVSDLLASSTESCITWLTDFSDSCSTILCALATHIGTYAVPILILLSIYALLTLILHFNQSHSTPWFFGLCTHSHEVELLIHDSVEVSDEEVDFFEHTEGDDVISVHDSDENDDNVDTDVDNDDEYIDYEENSDTPNSSDSNIASDTEDDSDDSDAISIQLPARSMHRNNSEVSQEVESGSVNSHQGDRESERSLCVICQDQIKSVLVLPCRHLCMCIDCAHTIADGIPGQRRTCPLCRTAIRTIMNIYT
jgi:hypothetical protein